MDRAWSNVDSLSAALKIAATGLGAQSERLRVVSENLANAQSTGDAPGSDPYRRKTISFSAELDRASGGMLVGVTEIGRDDSEFPVEFAPGHEAADDRGYVKMPNVNVLIEMADMREANRSYEANLQVIKQARELISMTIDLMRSQ
jgi:flagellar basal-body rod protein FlgC